MGMLIVRIQLYVDVSNTQFEFKQCICYQLLQLLEPLLDLGLHKYNSRPIYFKSLSWDSMKSGQRIRYGLTGSIHFNQTEEKYED